MRSMLSQVRVYREVDAAAAQARVDSILDEADQLIEESGATAFAPLIFEGRGRMSQTLGNAERAREQLGDAMQGYRANCATGHLARLAVELGE